jgi:hypothetical protein
MGNSLSQLRACHCGRVVAAGLIAFGIYSFSDARYRRI